VELRQSYARVGKFTLIKHQRYAHARQFNRAKLIFYSCGVGVSCKSLILQDTEAGFLKSVVPRIVEKCLIIVP